MTHPIPNEIKLLQRQGLLQLCYQDGSSYQLPCHILRQHSPAADARHNKDSERDFAEVLITAIEPVGNYAVKFLFDDGHKTGLFSYDLLYSLATRYDQARQPTRD